MRRIVIAFSLATLAVVGLTGAKKKAPDLVGAWCSADGDRWEFFDEGTTLLTPLAIEPAVGDYRFVDDHRIRVDWGGSWSMMVGPTIYEVTRDGSRMTLQGLDGQSTEMVVCTDDHEQLRRTLLEQRDLCAVTALNRLEGDILELTCPANCPALPVWGSDPYTADSAICTAATHSGRIGAEGGVVKVFVVEGFGHYEGSERHGVTTADWGSYGLSYTFDLDRLRRQLTDQPGEALPPRE